MPITQYRIKAVLFDFDGTLTQPGAIDFKAIKASLGCPAGRAILEFIHSLPSGAERRAAMEKLLRFEMAAAAESRPNDGAQEIVTWTKQQLLPVGIITRNSRDSVIRALKNFDKLGVDDFDVIITRDDPLAPKPSGEGIVWAAEQFQATPAQVLMVGDFIFDLQAGRAAGALTALVDPAAAPELQSLECDFRLQQLSALRPIIRGGMPLAAGKLPNDLLAPYLEALDIEDPSLLIHPGIGEDVAVIDRGGDDLIVLKSDPVTFSTDAIGRYAVAVNANDIATAGARPRWFLTTLLLPCGTTPSQAKTIMQQLSQNARRWGVTLCGGHTEITDAVCRPVVAGMMVGTVKRGNLIEKKNMAPGDAVLFTKGVAVEGTAIIAREFATRLLAGGITAQEINVGRSFLNHISILPEARLAAEDGRVSAMHDVTEGGLATALSELSVAGRHKISVEMENIPVLDQTRKFCGALGLNPLGLIGSGSLLICCPPDYCDGLIERLEKQSIAAAKIGKVMASGTGIEAWHQGRKARWPQFDTDEIARLYE